MGLDQHKHSSDDYKLITIFINIRCYISLISILLAEICNVVCITTWYLYGVKDYCRDLWLLALCIVSVFIAITDLECLLDNRELIFKIKQKAKER